MSKDFETEDSIEIPGLEGTGHKTTSMDSTSLLEKPTQTTTPSLEDKIRARISAYDAKVQVDPLIGTVIEERYKIEAKLGVGGMGAVYRAQQLGMDRKVAIKVLHKEYASDDQVRRRFHIEALAASRLTHPNTIRIYDFGESDEVGLFIVMEFLDGRPLDVILDTEGPLSVHRTLRIMSSICASLHEAHEENIVHRDLKPDNLFLIQVEDNPDFVKVLDFGVAKLITEKNQGKAGTLTLAGSVFGTPRYMAPEQCRSLGTDGRTDVYALGVIMYQCLSGVLPFDEDNPLTIMMMHLQQLPDPFIIRRPSVEIPVEIEQIVVNCMHKDPDERYASAQAMKIAVDAQLTSLEQRFEQVQLRTDEEISKLDISQSVTRKGVPISPTARSLPEEGELTSGGRPIWKWSVILGLIVLLGGSLAGFVYLAKGTVPSPEPHRLKKSNDLISAMVSTAPVGASRVQILSKPTGAEVSVDGAKVGKTPVTLLRNPGEAVSVTVSAQGYEPSSGREDFSSSRTQDFALKKIPVSPSTKATPPVKKSTVKRGTKKRATPATKKPTYRPDRLRDFKTVR